MKIKKISYIFLLAVFFVVGGFFSSNVARGADCTSADGKEGFCTSSSVDLVCPDPENQELAVSGSVLCPNNGHCCVEKAVKTGVNCQSKGGVCASSCPMSPVSTVPVSSVNDCPAFNDCCMTSEKAQALLPAVSNNIPATTSSSTNPSSTNTGGVDTVSSGIVPCGHGSDVSNACTLCHLIVGVKNIISFGQGLLITAAAFAIFVAGFLYVIAAGGEATTSAKNFLTASLTGFTIVLASWFIVNLVMTMLSYNTSLAIQKENWYTFTCATQSSTSSNPTAPVTYSENTLTDAQARQMLQAEGINITSSGNCSNINNPSCTSLEGIPKKTIEGVIAIKNTCSIAPTVTGGTETGHSSHGAGKTPVDFSWNESLAACIKSNASSLGVNKICTTAQDSQYRLDCNYDEPNRHIHIAF